MAKQSSRADKLIRAARTLRDRAEALSFSPPVTHVYNPLVYAWSAHTQYLRSWGDSTKRVLFMGMNPGPWGMAQVGIPFGEIHHAREWLGIQAPIGKPPREHPKRPIEGFECRRSEVSGRRMWGLFAERFGSAARFSEDHLVVNYCPLVFMEESARNRTPDKLPPSEREPLFEICDAHLEAVIKIVEPEWLIGIGGFAASRFEALHQNGHVRLGRILHPSPANPAANRDWAGAATRQLVDLGVW